MRFVLCVPPFHEPRLPCVFTTALNRAHFTTVWSVRSDTGVSGPLATCYGSVSQMGSIFSSLIVVCQSTDRNSLSWRRLTGFELGSGVERKGEGKGEDKFRRYTSKCDTGTHNNGGLAFLDRKLDSQFFQPFFLLSPRLHVVETGCLDGAAARETRALGLPPYSPHPSYDHEVLTESNNTRLPKLHTFLQTDPCLLTPAFPPRCPALFEGGAK